MLDVPVYSPDGTPLGKMGIDEAHLGGRVRSKLLKQAIVMYLANKRQGTSATKSRGMVEGSTRKIYRQKGTGNARMGPVRTPQRRGGGRAFAKSTHEYRQRMPKRMRRLACRNAILAKIMAHNAIILDGLKFDQPKVKALRGVLEAVKAERGCVLALEAPNETVYRCGRNIPRTDVRPWTDLNAYDVLRREKLIFTKPAFEALVAQVAKS